MKFLRKDVTELIHMGRVKTTIPIDDSPAPVPSTLSFNHTNYSIDLNVSNCSPTKSRFGPVASSTPNKLPKPSEPKTTLRTSQQPQDQAQPQPQAQPQQQPFFISPDRQLHFQAPPQQPFFQPNFYNPFFAAQNNILTRNFLDQRTVETVFNSATGINNFAQRLMRHIFTSEERKGKSVYGTKRNTKDGLIIKEGLDKNKIEFIKEKVFAMFSTPFERQQMVWASCVESMNEYLRRKKLNKSDIF